MKDFPPKICFVNTGEILELVNDEDEKPLIRPLYSKRGKPAPVLKKTVPKSRLYRYTNIPLKKSKEPSKKLNTTIEFELNHLIKLKSFNSIECF